MVQIMIRSIALIIMMALVPTGAFAANTAQQVDFLMSGSLMSDGTPNAGGKVYTCDAGTVCGPSTSDPKTTWEDAGKLSNETNPVILDSNGTASIFADGKYKFQIYDSDDVLIETIDNVYYFVLSEAGSVQVQDTLTPSSQTISISVDTYYCNAQTGEVTTDFTGVSAIGNTGKRFTFKKIDSTANLCIVDVLSIQTIDGADTAVLSNQYDDITIESDGANWTEVRGMIWSRAATFHNTLTVYNAATFDAATFNEAVSFKNTTTFYNASTFNDASTFNNTVSWSKGVDIASTNTITPGPDGNYFDITGTTDIGAINTVGVGTTIKLHFDDAVTLIYNATDLVLPGVANITTSAGDEYEFTEYASGDWRVTGRSINADGTITEAMLEDFIAANTILSWGVDQGVDVACPLSSGRTKMLQITVLRAGQIRLSIAVKRGSTDEIDVRFRKNGSNESTATGTSSSYQTKTYDMTVAVGDYVEIDVQGTGNNGADTAKNPKITTDVLAIGAFITGFDSGQAIQ